eukprot:CAMPEP_0113637394 /NCGR_PEP_ID=MMETSP0017_2-20120614/19571_1 /TAXON_ID=2856 /ORGANISM="Cylindrotheca closterium" /LENGTH=340 /DNA_ID=CAMNT_0000548415 /DNA_START=79 /DNA_END=1101 /DNA_ORIENTATION=+ /assembly_acc=CAM_ASM_000147
MRSSSKVVLSKKIPVEETTFCDSMWACLLNDYGDEENSIKSDTEQDIEYKMRKSREQRNKGRRDRERRSSSRSVSKTRSRSKSRNAAERDGHRRRGSSAHSRRSSHQNKPRRDSYRIEDDQSERDSREGRDGRDGRDGRNGPRNGRESRNSPRESPRDGRDGIPTKQEPVKEIQIPHAPSTEMRKSRDPDASKSNRKKTQVDNEPAVDESREQEKKSNKKMERKRPEKLTINDNDWIHVDDSPRDTTPAKREEAPPVLFRPIKNRYNPKSPTANSPRSPRVMSPMSSPRSPSHFRVDSAEFNTMEDYQKKVLAARDKRSHGRKFERIQAIRAKSLNKVDP